MLRFERTEVRLEGAEREPHDDFASGLGTDLIDHVATTETGLWAVPIDRNELDLPATRLHKINERLESAFGPR